MNIQSQLIDCVLSNHSLSYNNLSSSFFSPLVSHCITPTLQWCECASEKCQSWLALAPPAIWPRPAVVVQTSVNDSVWTAFCGFREREIAHQQRTDTNSGYLISPGLRSQFVFSEAHRKAIWAARMRGGQLRTFCSQALVHRQQFPKLQAANQHN